jgi:hypothetical protein
MEIEIARIVLRQPFDQKRRSKEPVEDTRGQVPDQDPFTLHRDVRFVFRATKNPLPPTVARA